MGRRLLTVTVLSVAVFGFALIFVLVVSRHGVALARASIPFPVSTSTTKLVSTTKTPFIPRIGSLMGHHNTVLSIAYSPDGRFIVTAGLDSAVKLWDAGTQMPQLGFKATAYNINQLAFSPDGRQIAGASTDRTILLWDAASGKQIAQFRRYAFTRSLAFSADGQTLASLGADETVWLWDVASGARQYPSNGLSFGPYGAAFAVVNPAAQLWDTAIGKRLALAGERGARIVTLSRDGTLLAGGGGADRTIRLLDLTTGQQFTLTNTVGVTHNMAFSPDGAVLAGASDDGNTRLWNTASGNLIGTLYTNDESAYCMAFSPDSSVLATCSDDGAARLWGLKGH